MVLYSPIPVHGLKHGLKYLKYQLCSILEGYNKYGALYTITRPEIRPETRPLGTVHSKNGLKHGQ